MFGYGRKEILSSLAARLNEWNSVCSNDFYQHDIASRHAMMYLLTMDWLLGLPRYISPGHTVRTIFRNVGARKVGGNQVTVRARKSTTPVQAQACQQSASRGASAQPLDRQNTTLLSNAIRAACSSSPNIAKQQGSCCTHAWVL